MVKDKNGLKGPEDIEQFNLLNEQIPVAYQSLDENGDLIEVNQVWLKTLGFTKEEVIGRNFADFLPPDWVDHFKENFPRFKAVGEVLGVEFEMVKKDGSTMLVSFNGKIGRDPQGRFKRPTVFSRTSPSEPNKPGRSNT